MQIWRLLTGPEDIGQTAWFWTGFAIFIAFLAAYPAFISEFEATNMAFYLLNIPLALGLCLLWGYCGVLSFGQVAFVGIAVSANQKPPIELIMLKSANTTL